MQTINKHMWAWYAWPTGYRPCHHIHQQISNAVVSSASSTPVAKSAHAV